MVNEVMRLISSADPEVGAVIEAECLRQKRNLELIASENIVSEAVMLAMGTVLTNKYAEGTPGKRYYGGCDIVDEVETIAIERAKKLFGCEFANVQPHSGAQANMAVELAVLVPGDTILSMNLDHGGHLSHGSAANFSGKYFRVVPYGVNEEGFIDYDAVEALAKEHRPKLIICGASAYARTIDFKRFREIADSVDAVLLADIAHIAGLVAAGVHPSPVPYAHIITTTTHKTLRGPRGGLILCKEKYAKAIDKAVFPGMQGGPLMHVIAAKAVSLKEALQPGFKEYAEQIVKNCHALCDELVKGGFNLVSGGSDNHLILIDVRNKHLTGKAAEKALDAVRITVNKNTVPNETESPFVTSGIRLGTAALTTRGMKEDEMRLIGKVMTDALNHPEDAAVIADCSARIEALCKRFPLYPEVE